MRKYLIKYRGKRTQKEMAKKYNVTQQTWCNWEQGKSCPRIPIMKKIEKDSGYSIKSLFFELL
mgnify:FL=1